MRCERRRADALVRRLLLLLATTGLSPGCGGGDSCVRNSDCAPPLVCGAAGLCALPPDGPAADGGASVDAPVDATVDAGDAGDGGHAADAAPPTDASAVDAAAASIDANATVDAAPGGPP